jgi:hypothetical protein
MKRREKVDEKEETVTNTCNGYYLKINYRFSKWFKLIENYYLNGLLMSMV